MKKLTALVALLIWCVTSAWALTPEWREKLGTFEGGKLEQPAPKPSPANPWAGKLGTFDAQRRLQNPTAAALRISIRSFGSYFPESGDFNLGFSVSPFWDPRRHWDFSIDLAPHRVGGAVNYLQVPFLGLGAGIQLLYNTHDDRFEPGLKIQFKRW